MENLMELLGSRYLDIRTYFREAGKVFMEMVRTGKAWFISTFTFYVILRIFSGIVLSKHNMIWKYIEIIDKVDFSEQERAMKVINEATSVIKEFTFILLTMFFIIILVYVFYNLMLREIISKIEGKKEITLGKAVYRSLVCTFMFVGFIVMIAVIFNMKVSAFVKSLFPVLLINFMLKSLYFFPLYMSRDIKFLEAIKYGFYLSRGNKRRILLPLVIIFISSVLFSNILLYIRSLVAGGIFDYSVQIVALLVDASITVYFLIVVSIIYLNREYMDIRNLYKSEDGDKEQDKIVL